MESGQGERNWPVVIQQPAQVGRNVLRGRYRIPPSRKASHLTALIFSIAPFGQSFAYLSTYFFWAKDRKAFWSGA